MDTREALLAAALQVLEKEGQAQFSTRAVCAIADVTAPTLYHHFGSADGLLSAAIAAAFERFLDTKRAAMRSSDPFAALRAGWDSYVRFAAERPRLYAAMMARILQGADIPAANEARAMLVECIDAIGAVGRLTTSKQTATQVALASASAAALLHVAAAQTAAEAPPVAAEVIDRLRDAAIESICKP